MDNRTIKAVRSIVVLFAYVEGRLERTYVYTNILTDNEQAMYKCFLQKQVMLVF